MNPKNLRKHNSELHESLRVKLWTLHLHSFLFNTENVTKTILQIAQPCFVPFFDHAYIYLTPLHS